MIAMAKPDASDPAALEAAAWRLAQQGNMKAALTACRDLNQRHPDFTPGWRTASLLFQRAGDRRRALVAIEQAVEREPDQPEWRLQQAYCLMALGRNREARPILLDLLECKLSGPWQHSTMGLLLSRQELQAEAEPHYREAAALEPADSQHRYNLATVLRFLGKFDEAQACLAEALKLDPLNSDAHKLRADLRRVTPENNHVSALRAVLPRLEHPRRRADVGFALAKELEDLEQYPESFDALAEAAALRRAHMRYDVSGDLETMAAIGRHFDQDWWDNTPDGDGQPAPIFVLGMPRTGTTLVERLLATHSAVASAGELNDFALAMTDLARAVDPPPENKLALVERCTGLDFRALGQRYMTRVQAPDALHFIDKMPLNFLYTGLIAKALPRARIIHVTRDPMDTCYAIFKTSFQDAYPFSYDLEDLGRYYLAYRELMAHWQGLPFALHEVRYESLVADTEAEAKALLAFCGLDWEPAILEFHQNSAPSTTASASQIREPVYRSSVGKWKHYREQLVPLSQLLADAGLPFED